MKAARRDVGHEMCSARFILIANPGSRRVELFQAALVRCGHHPAFLVPWIDLLHGDVDLRDVVGEGDIVRIDSPGKDFEVEKAFLLEGADAPDDDYAHASRREIEALTFDKGRILYSRQWYRGFCSFLLRLAPVLNLDWQHPVTQLPGGIARLFDKRTCSFRMCADRVPTPKPILDDVMCFEHLTEKMAARNMRRVFVKLAHGSSASGCVAYETDGRGRHRATTTVEMVRTDGELRLYNSRRLRVHENATEIAQLIDALCPHRVHVEQWVPKAGINGKTFDLRVLVIAGRAQHVVARLSDGPMTNLHLLNERGDVDPIRRRMGEDAWAAAMHSCERAAACFHDCLHVGIDLAITTDFRKHAVLEANAFGDLLPGVLCDGVDTYTAEIMAVTGDGICAKTPRDQDAKEKEADV